MPLLSHLVQNLMFFTRARASLQNLLALLCTLAGLAHAQMASVPSAGIEITRLEVLHHAPQGLTLAQVQSGQVGAFVPHEGLYVSHQQWHRAVWLKLHLRVNPNTTSPARSAVLFLPTPYLDKVWLYTPAAQPDQPWAVQQAGDFFEPKTWAMRSFHPKFELPKAGDAAWQGGQELTLFLRVDHIAPVRLHLEIGEAAAILDRDALNLLIYGIGLGTILIVALLTAAMAWLHRDTIYAWYSGFAVCGALGCASHSGLAQNVLWPIGGYWPSSAALCFILLAAMFQMRFSLALNEDRVTRHILRYCVHAASMVCAVLALSFIAFTPYWQVLYYCVLPVLACSTGLSIWLLVVGLRAGQRMAGFWLLSYVPLFVTIVLALLEGIGVLPSSYWSYSLVIYVVIFEILLLGLALQWFASERHGVIERRKALATLDPLTGFVSAQAFGAQLSHDWASSQRQDRHLAVVYVQLQTRAKNDHHMHLLLARCVRILRSATSAQDVVARLDGALLALLIYGVPRGDALNQKLSRIVALGLMPDASDQSGGILQFRIAVTTTSQFTRPVAELNAQMRELLSQSNGWGSKPIRYIDHAQRIHKNPLVIDSVALEETWEAAFKQEMQGSSTQPH